MVDAPSRVSTPRRQAPFEGASHARCWMAWPNPEAEWPDLELAQDAFARLIAAVASFEPVTVLVRAEEEALARRSLPGEVELWVRPIDDVWLRDSGPTFLADEDGGVSACVDWNFNGWGRKWPWRRDAEVAAAIADREGLQRLAAPLVCEGGALAWDGEGTVLATRQSVLHANRNPEISERCAEREILELLGAEHLIWLDQGLCADHTDGHVDEVAAFVAPGVVVAASAEEGHPDHARLLANRLDLEKTPDARGRTLEVVDLPLPRRQWMHDEELALSYVNFYLPNGAVVVPAFDDAAADDRASGVLSELFPDRQILQLPALGVAQNGGGFHCVTQQQPAVTEGSSHESA